MSIPTQTNLRPAAALARIAAQNAARAAMMSPRALIHAHRHLRWRLGVDAERPAPPTTWPDDVVALVERFADASLAELRERVDVAPQAVRGVVRDLDVERRARRRPIPSERLRGGDSV